MNTEPEKIHIHKTSFKTEFAFLLLLIPSIVFVLILALYIHTIPDNGRAYSKTNSAPAHAKELPKGLGIAKLKNLEIPLVVADSEVEQRKGLGSIDEFPEDAGMLFTFGKENIRPAFWMKDVRFPLDIIWINDGKIAQIHKNLEPQLGVTDSQLTLYLPNDPIDYVLEVNGGFSDTHNLVVGDEIEIILN